MINTPSDRTEGQPSSPEKKSSKKRTAGLIAGTAATVALGAMGIIGSTSKNPDTSSSLHDEDKPSEEKEILEQKRSEILKKYKSTKEQLRLWRERSREHSDEGFNADLWEQEFTFSEMDLAQINLKLGREPGDDRD